MPQITAYLSELERLELSNYARKFGLDGSGMANLLLARELRVGRLLSSEHHHTSLKPMLGRKKITAHQSDDRVIKAFKAHAAVCNVTVSTALASVIRAELAEQWLDNVLNIIDSD